MHHLLALSFLLLTGCFTRHQIRPGDLVALNGFDASVQQSRGVLTASKEAVAFTSDNLTLQTSTQTIRGEFLRLSVKEGLLTGTLRDAQQVSIALTDLKSVQLRSFNPSHTALLVLSIIGSVASIVGGTVMVLGARLPLGSH